MTAALPTHTHTHTHTHTDTHTHTHTHTILVWNGSVWHLQLQHFLGNLPKRNSSRISSYNIPRREGEVDGFTSAPWDPQNPVPSSVEACRNIGDWRPREKTKKTCIIMWVLLETEMNMWKVNNLETTSVWYPSLDRVSKASASSNYVYII